MAERWIRRDLTDEERKAFDRITQRDFTVYVETNGGNTKFTVQKPIKSKRTR